MNSNDKRYSFRASVNITSDLYLGNGFSLVFLFLLNWRSSPNESSWVSKDNGKSLFFWEALTVSWVIFWEESKELAIKLLNLKENDKIIITGGYPFKEVKHTNFIKIEEL